MKVTIAGTGYVGLVSGACLAEVGNKALCLDLDPEKIRILDNDDTTTHNVILAKGTQDAQAWWQQRSRINNLTAQEQTTWYGFTQAILGNATITNKPRLTPIATQDYPLPAKRPTYSSLSCERLMNTFCGLPAWENSLKFALS